MMNEQNKVWAVRAGAVGLGALILVALVPFLWSLVSAGLALGALLGIGTVLVGLVQLLPYFGQKMENTVLQLRKGEARKNPIEQLQNHLREKRQKVNAFRNALAQINTQIKGLEGMVQERKQTKRNYDPAKHEASIAAMKKAYGVMEKKYHAAEEALVQMNDAIEEKAFEWKFSQAGQAAIQSLNASSDEDLMSAMLADEAGMAVLENFNAVFAELEIEANRISSSEKMDFGGLTLDLTAVRIPEFQKVPA